jgi:hypothetical protein
VLSDPGFSVTGKLCVRYVPFGSRVSTLVGDGTLIATLAFSAIAKVVVDLGAPEQPDVVYVASVPVYVPLPR